MFKSSIKTLSHSVGERIGILLKSRNIFGEVKSDVTEGSSKIFWWKCSKGDDHEWKSSFNAKRWGKHAPKSAEQLDLIKGKSWI